MNKAYGYVRVSTDKQAQKGLSLDAQEKKIKQYAKLHDLELEHVFVESGVSASTPLLKRPEGKKIYNILQQGDSVIATKLDRIFRDVKDAVKIRSYFLRRGYELHLIDMGGKVTGNEAIANLYFNMLSSFAQFERDTCSERIRVVKENERAKGRYLGGDYPFGYAVTMDGRVELHPEEQRAIGTMIMLRKEGVSLRNISKEIKSKHGISVSHETVNSILKKELSRTYLQ
tara:strand:+ start:110 stop:796 length:687 start_codon:yes stop_codon:yes gene_type:complete